MARTDISSTRDSTWVFDVDPPVHKYKGMGRRFAIPKVFRLAFYGPSKLGIPIILGVAGLLFFMVLKPKLDEFTGYTESQCLYTNSYPAKYSSYSAYGVDYVEADLLVYSPPEVATSKYTYTRYPRDPSETLNTYTESTDTTDIDAIAAQLRSADVLVDCQAKVFSNGTTAIRFVPESGDLLAPILITTLVPWGLNMMWSIAAVYVMTSSVKKMCTPEPIARSSRVNTNYIRFKFTNNMGEVTLTRVASSPQALAPEFLGGNKEREFINKATKLVSSMQMSPLAMVGNFLGFLAFCPAHVLGIFAAIATLPPSMTIDIVLICEKLTKWLQEEHGVPGVAVATCGQFVSTTTPTMWCSTYSQMTNGKYFIDIYFPIAAASGLGHNPSTHSNNNNNHSSFSTARAVSGTSQPSPPSYQDSAAQRSAAEKFKASTMNLKNKGRASVSVGVSRKRAGSPPPPSRPPPSYQSAAVEESTARPVNNNIMRGAIPNATMEVDMDTFGDTAGAFGDAAGADAFGDAAGADAFGEGEASAPPVEDEEPGWGLDADKEEDDPWGTGAAEEEDDFGVSSTFDAGWN